MKLSVFILLLIGGSLLGCGNTESRQLKEAYEKYHQVLIKSDFTLETTELSEVATGKALQQAIRSIEQQSLYPEIRSQDIEIEDFEIIQIQDTEATVQFKVFYRKFHQDRATGERVYWSEKGRYWYITLTKMVKEDGVWKVAESESIDWSG